MENLFLESVNILSQAAPEEKEAAALMYTTYFIRMLRQGGYLYRRELGADKTASIVMIVNGKEYRCQEALIRYYTGNTLNLNPYEDTTNGFNELVLIEEKDILKEEPVETKEKKVIELPRIEIAEKVAFEDLPEAPEITLSKDEQADYLIETTEYYKIGAGLNFIAALACIVFSVVVLVLC